MTGERAAAYAEFLAAKLGSHKAAGITVAESAIHPLLYPFQRRLTRWALAKGRSAIFADCGLGKTFMQLEWARMAAERTLIIAPLAVAQQTVREATRIDLSVMYARSQGQALSSGITITNYEMVERFDPASFGAVVLDESSILKALDGKTRKLLTDLFSETPMRLCCTATPAPNDIAEIANHAEFLGILSRPEMLARFFVHDDQGWRLKRHAREPFYRWLASWGMCLKKPSDIGFPDTGYDLPPLSIVSEIVAAEYVPEGQLFATGLKGITDRAKVRRETLETRVNRALELIENADEQWVAWCGLNDEQDALAAGLDDRCVSIYGALPIDEKVRRIQRWLDHEVSVLVSKPSICGFGLNLQQAHRMVFVGLSDSYESYYQCIRRCWRFGQTAKVFAHIVLSDAEGPIYENVRRKEEEAECMSSGLLAHVAEYERAELTDNRNGHAAYQEEAAEGDTWRLLQGDCVERIREVESESVDLSVFSPPFLSLYVYSPSERDMGNSNNPAEYFQHFNFLIDELLRVTKPGRNCAVHIAQVTATQQTDGFIGMKDFRGDMVRAFVGRGWVYHGEVCIDKDPQAQAIRTHSKGLLFVQLRKDSSWLRPALADYILVFRKPGENAIPVQPDITNDEWIEWARPIWYGIRESDTLNVAVARAEPDERHIVPLQLGTIERVIRLWSNPGELVLSPFAGIGSEGYESVRLGRHFVGIELKPEYWRTAVKNLKRAESERGGRLL